MSPRTYPTCPTHQLQMYVLAEDAQRMTHVLAEWLIMAGPRGRAAYAALVAAKHRATTPELRLREPHQQNQPQPRKARTS